MARTAALRGFVDDIGDWSGGSGPLYRQLSTAIARAIERGAISHGDRLPSERSLALALSIGRGTALSTYDRLEADGLIERRAGSGTFVIDPDRLSLPAGREGSALVARLVDRSAGPTDVIDLSISVLHEPDRLPPASITTADLSDVAPLTGYSPWGLLSLRVEVAALLDRWGLPTRPEQVVVTTGAQQAISIAAACWVRPGDLVIVDEPTYPGALSAFTAAGARLTGVPLDASGVQLDRLARALDDRPALVYLQSMLHNPTGVVLAASRRAHIAELLGTARVPCVEDVALGGLTWVPGPPPIAAHAPEQPIAVVGSLSKLFWGGLRLGFVRAPEPVALRFARVKATHDLGSSAVGQLFAQRALEHPDWQQRVSERNAELHRRCRFLMALLDHHVRSWRWGEPAGGLSLWVQLPTPSAPSFAATALRHGVSVATADPLSVAGGHHDRLRLSFGVPESELTIGVERLARAWAEHSGCSGGNP